MTTITQTRGHWTAKVSGYGTLPVMCDCNLQDDMLALSWQTRDARDTTLAQKQFDAVVKQLTAGNPQRKIRAVLTDSAVAAKDGAKKLYEFTLANVKVNRFTNGTASYNYLLTDGHEVA